MADDETVQPMSRGRLLLAVAGAAVAAGVILFAAVLPAQFGRDPTGLGKLTGLGRLWAPSEVKIDASAGAVPLAREYSAGFRSDVVEIPLTSLMQSAKGYELEYKVRMRKDATLIYEWRVLGAENPEDLYYDFHGHTLSPDPGVKMTVATYRQAYGDHQQGALTAPFDGIQGWYFQSSAARPVVVRLRLSGFYELVPPGQPGNEAGILANGPAAKTLGPNR